MGKTSGVEIERKFLINPQRLPPLGKGKRLEQFYLSRGPCVRVRISKNKAWLTVKGPGDIERAEFEYQIPLKDAEAMRPLSKTSVISKVRYLVTVGQHTWEVDEFRGRFKGLWLAEIELSARNESFTFPSWVGKEVTEDRRYSNAYLAECGSLAGLELNVREC